MHNRRFLLTLSIAALLVAGCAAEIPGAVRRELPTPWPPRVGEPYPDLELLDAADEPLQLSTLRGKVILLEPIGMNCPACNAFADGNRPQVGGLRDLEPQGGLPGVAEMLNRYAGVRLSDRRLVLVHLLLYDFTMEAPDVEDARLWDEHFRVAKDHGKVVVPAVDLRGPAAYNLIPGFQLIDRDFVLRYDSSGHRPTHSLWQQLLPALPRLLAGR